MTSNAETCRKVVAACQYCAKRADFTVHQSEQGKKEQGQCSNQAVHQTILTMHVPGKTRMGRYKFDAQTNELDSSQATAVPRCNSQKEKGVHGFK